MRAADTQRRIYAMGKWPDNFPPPPAGDAAPTPDAGNTMEFF